MAARRKAAPATEATARPAEQLAPAEPAPAPAAEQPATPEAATPAEPEPGAATAATTSEPAAKAAEPPSGKYAEAIGISHQAGESGSFFGKSYGYAVFPTIGEAGLGVGGAHGKGRVYVGGRHVGDTRVTQLSIGLHDKYNRQVYHCDLQQSVIENCKTIPGYFGKNSHTFIMPSDAFFDRWFWILQERWFSSTAIICTSRCARTLSMR